MTTRPSIKVGDRFTNNQGLVAEVVEYVKANKVKIRFKIDGYERWVQATHLRAGGFKHKRDAMDYHGKYGTPENVCYRLMKRRCYNKNTKEYGNYGERGIRVCSRWLNSFTNFLEDMGEKPNEGDTVGRINPKGDYTPENCRWENKELQARCKRKPKTNTSGVTGVRYCKHGARWVAMWNEDGRQRNKYFPVKKHGDELAELFAIEFREKKIWELNQLGYGYSKYHGK